MKRRDAQLIEEIRQYLDDNLLHQHTSGTSAVNSPSIGKSYSSAFNELVQFTVHAYIIRQRLERAAQRLLESDDSIKAIAIESGYKKQRSFNKSRMDIWIH